MAQIDITTVRDVFVDESSQTKHRFLVLGGIICRAAETSALSARILEERLPELPGSELKWSKISPAKLPAYRRVVDVFFENRPAENPVHFHSIVVEMANRNDFVFNAGSREMGFNKEVYQLLMKFGRLYRDCSFHVYPDSRETKSSPDELRLILNRGLAAKGDRRDWPYRRLHFKKSHEVPILQLTDLLIGAIAFHLNGHRQAAGASAAKCDLSDYILERAGIRNVTRDTLISGRFTIWHRRLRRVP